MSIRLYIHLYFYLSIYLQVYPSIDLSKIYLFIYLCMSFINLVTTISPNSDDNSHHILSLSYFAQCTTSHCFSRLCVIKRIERTRLSPDTKCLLLPKERLSPKSILTILISSKGLLVRAMPQTWQTKRMLGLEGVEEEVAQRDASHLNFDGPTQPRRL